MDMTLHNGKNILLNRIFKCEFTHLSIAKYRDFALFSHGFHRILHRFIQAFFRMLV